MPKPRVLQWGRETTLPVKIPGTLYDWMRADQLDDRIFEAILTTGRDEAQRWLAKKKITSLRLVQGARSVSRGEQARALNSWTASYRWAQIFSNRVGEHVVVADIPARDIVSIRGRGLGVKGQWEVLVTGTHRWRPTYGGSILEQTVT